MFANVLFCVEKRERIGNNTISFLRERYNMIRAMIEIFSYNTVNVLEDLAGVSAIFVIMLVLLYFPFSSF